MSMKLFLSFATAVDPEMSLTEYSVWWKKSNFKSGIEV